MSFRRLPLLKRVEDLRPFLFASGFLLYQLLVFVLATDPLEALLLVAVPHFVLQVALMNVQHISIHHGLFRSRLLEHAFGVVCTLALGFTRACFAVDHLRHHRHYLDPQLDTNTCHGDKGALRRHRYALRHLFTVYPRTWRLAWSDGSQIAWEYFGELAAVLSLCTLLILAKPAVALAVFVYPMIYNILATYYWAHHQHADLDPTDPFSASRTFDNGFFNWLSFNVGYHAAHHYRPGVHWSRLPALHESLRHHMPEELTLHAIPWLSSEYGPRRPTRLT
jgi:fatty acid desaturase